MRRTQLTFVALAILYQVQWSSTVWAETTSPGEKRVQKDVCVANPEYCCKVLKIDCPNK